MHGNFSAMLPYHRSTVHVCFCVSHHVICTCHQKINHDKIMDALKEHAEEYGHLRGGRVVDGGVGSCARAGPTFGARKTGIARKEVTVAGASRAKGGRRPLARTAMAGRSSPREAAPPARAAAPPHVGRR